MTVPTTLSTPTLTWTVAPSHESRLPASKLVAMHNPAALFHELVNVIDAGLRSSDRADVTAARTIRAYLHGEHANTRSLASAIAWLSPATVYRINWRRTQANGRCNVAREKRPAHETK